MMKHTQPSFQKLSFLETEGNFQSKRQRSSETLKNTIIVGWNRESLNLFDKISEYPALGYNVKGFISVKEQGGDKQYKNIPLLGDISVLPASVSHGNIEEILIAVDPQEQMNLDEVLRLCKQSGVHFTIVSDVYDTVFGNVVRNVFSEVFRAKEFGFRRIFDIGASTLLLILFLPLFVITAIAIKLESKGSILYSQLRIGKEGNKFRIYKFRSMVQDAEQKSGPVWAQKNDPRITKMGNFMRKTRIDELPQLINVFQGDMSFIGPRPERPFFVDSFKQQIPLYTNRLQVKPGVTGWAQVRWGYDETLDDVKEKLNHDLYYINNKSLPLDIKIFFLTIHTVLTGKGQ